MGKYYLIGLTYELYELYVCMYVDLMSGGPIGYWFD